MHQVLRVCARLWVDLLTLVAPFARRLVLWGSQVGWGVSRAGSPWAIRGRGGPGVEIPLRDARPGPRASPTHPLTRMPGLVVHILERTLVRERQRECIELAKKPLASGPTTLSHPRPLEAPRAPGRHQGAQDRAGSPASHPPRHGVPVAEGVADSGQARVGYERSAGPPTRYYRYSSGLPRRLAACP